MPVEMQRTDVVCHDCGGTGLTTVVFEFLGTEIQPCSTCGGVGTVPALVPKGKKR